MSIYLAMKLFAFLGAFWLLRRITLKDWHHIAIDALFAVGAFFTYVLVIETAAGIGFDHSPFHEWTLKAASAIRVREFLAKQEGIAILAYILGTTYFNYWSHRVFHKIGALWELHKTHHSATRLTGLSQYRVHPLEEVVSTYAAPVVITLLLPDMGPRFAIYFGMFLMLHNTAIHSEWKSAWGRWSLVFTSPAAHQIHHSTNPKHFDSNFGVPFSIWDRLHGTYIDPMKTEAPKSFGVEDVRPTDFRALLWMPIVRCVELARRPAGLVVRDDDALREGQLRR